MKTVNRFSALLIVLFFSIFFFRPSPSAAQNFQVSFQVFYDNLEPYGAWVYDPNYGYVWIPDAGPDFMPYSTNGHWVFTEYGWTWVSDYSWGWAPFHYGRWYFDPVYGHIWVPGSDWGPAWVSWRRANGYYGWAPLGPDINVHIAMSNSYHIPYDRWIFVNEHHLLRHDIHRYHVNRHENVTIINNSTVINNTYIDNSRNITYISGPDRTEFQKRTGRNLRTSQVRDISTPGTRETKDQVQIYRPRVENRAGDNKRVAPARVANYKDIKPVNERRDDARLKSQPVRNERSNDKATNDRINRKDVQTAPVNRTERTNQNQNLRQEKRTGQENVQRSEPQQPVQKERRNVKVKQEGQRQDVIRQDNVRPDRDNNTNVRKQERQQKELKQKSPARSDVRQQNREKKDATKQQRTPRSGRNDRK